MPLSRKELTCLGRRAVVEGKCVRAKRSQDAGLYQGPLQELALVVLIAQQSQQPGVHTPPSSSKDEDVSMH